MTPLTCCGTLTALLAAFLAAFLLASDAPPYSLPLLLESICESSYHPQLSPNVDEDIGFILHAHENTLRVAHLEALDSVVVLRWYVDLQRPALVHPPEDGRSTSWFHVDWLQLGAA